MCRESYYSHLNNTSNGYLNNLPHSESSSIRQKNLLKTNFTNTAELIDFAIPQKTTTIQSPTQSLSIQQDLQINGCNFFHYTPRDDKFYHIKCKKILQDSISFNHDYDYAFFYQSLNDTSNYYVTCNLLSHSLIVNILNRKIH